MELHTYTKTLDGKKYTVGIEGITTEDYFQLDYFQSDYFQTGTLSVSGNTQTDSVYLIHKRTTKRLE